ncbi:hypothetical protein J2848_003336 [Azospirillum lipoferum]|nr:MULTISPECIES: hypothetical protein [Azospirillum]MCP1611658.1 hypothetical protein [Azospirillum lipoferum]MDW5533583.1 hypothetical protein [Azospirillum sp. NL1]
MIGETAGETIGAALHALLLTRAKAAHPWLFAAPASPSTSSSRRR